MVMLYEEVAQRILSTIPLLITTQQTDLELLVETTTIIQEHLIVQQI
jgi:hypothetical protein